MSEPHGASNAARLVVPALSDHKSSSSRSAQQPAPEDIEQDLPEQPRRSSRRRSERSPTSEEGSVQEPSGWRERLKAAWKQSSARQKAGWAACAVAAVLLVGWVASAQRRDSKVRDDDELTALTAALKHPDAEKPQVVQASASQTEAGSPEAQHAIHFAPADRGPESEQIERVEFVPVQRAARGAVWLSGTIEDATESSFAT